MALRNEREIDQFNQQLRANPAYRQFLQSIGVDVNRAIGLNDRQRETAKQWVRQHVGDIGNLEIDPAGNVNQNEGVGKWAKDWRTYAAIGGGLTGFGLAGMGPLGFLGGSAAAPSAGAASAGAAEAGVLPSASIAGLHAAVPASIASQGVSSALGTAMPATVGAIEAAGTSALGSAAKEAAGGGASGFLKSLATPENGAALAALIAGLSGSRGSNQPSAETQRIQAMTEARMRRADPLHEVAVNLAYGRMPVNYRQGVNLNKVPLPE